MGETLPQLKIAKKYIEKDGKGIFFSHGGSYEHLAEESGFEIVRLENIKWAEAEASIRKKKIAIEKKYYIAYKNIVETLVESEIEAFKNAGIDLVISSFNPTCSISTRVLKIPLVVLISGTVSSLYYRSGFATFPENYENVFTNLLPTSFKKHIIKWMLLNNKFLVKKFNKVAKKYNIRSFKTFNDILEGDHTFLCDDINFLGVKPTEKFSIENFIGPVSMGVSDDQVDELDSDVKKHLEKPGRSILFIMGSSPRRKIFFNSLDVINQTDYNTIVVYTNVPSEKLPKTKENILLKQFIKSPQIVNKMVDLAIIHGGRGTVYNVAYAGKPSIGIPTFIEQQYYIDNLVRNGAGLRISGKFFKPEELLHAIDKIFNNYDTFLKNAQELSAKLQRDLMEEKAFNRLIEILKEKTSR
jgi:UDP:flavonoid glycosyltransferase YjiC (YdhE family)